VPHLARIVSLDQVKSQSPKERPQNFHPLAQHVRSASQPLQKRTKKAIYDSPANKQAERSHANPFTPSRELSRSQRQSSRHGPKRAVALAIGPVFRLPSAVEHGAQPVRIIEVSIKFSFCLL
jgi:hypothetical protein